MPGHIIQTLSKYDEALQKADSDNYQLSIRLSADGFSFCIFDETRNKFLSVESNLFPNVKNTENFCTLFEEVFQNHQWLNLPYKRVNILFESPKSTLIPTPLYDANENENYARLNFTFSDDQKIKTDKLANVDAYKLYTVPKQIIDLLNRLFPGNKLYSNAGVLIESLLILNKNLPSHKRCYINAGNSWLDIVITEGRRLLYYNAFNYKTKEDFIYYLIFVLDQLKLNPEEIELILLGFIDKNSKLFEMVYKYVRNITLQPLTESFKYSYIFNDVPAHYYFTLLNFYLCEL